MTTVTLTKRASGFRNIPASYDVGDTDRYQDSHLVTVATYELPEGYHVAVSKGDDECIYDPSGAHCHIVEHRTGRPMLVSASNKAPVLAPATSDVEG